MWFSRHSSSSFVYAPPCWYSWLLESDMPVFFATSDTTCNVSDSKLMHWNYQHRQCAPASLLALRTLADYPDYFVPTSSSTKIDSPLFLLFFYSADRWSSLDCTRTLHRHSSCSTSVEMPALCSRSTHSHRSMNPRVVMLCLVDICVGISHLEGKKNYHTLNELITTSALSNNKRE